MSVWVAVVLSVVASVTAAEGPGEPVAKLPPPVAPGMDTNTMPSMLNRPGAFIDRNALKGTNVVVAPNSLKARQEAERERLDRNALNLQLDRAAKGSAIAMRSIGMRYLKGEGLPKDEAAARKWLQKGADGGDPVAKKELEKLGPAKESSAQP